MAYTLNTKTDTLYYKNRKSNPDPHGNAKSSSSSLALLSKPYFSKSDRFLDQYNLVDCFELSFYTTSSALRIYECLCYELGLPCKPLSYEATIDFLKTYQSDKLIDQTIGKSLRVIPVKDNDDLFGLMVVVRCSVSKPMKVELKALKLYDEGKERVHYRSANVIDCFAVSKKGVAHLGGINRNLMKQLISVEVEKRQGQFSAKLAKLETCRGLNTKRVDDDFDKLKLLLNYLGAEICTSGETHHDVYLKTTKGAISKDNSGCNYHFKVYKKLMADSRPGQIRLELVEHNVSMNKVSLDGVLVKHYTFLDEVGAWLLECLNPKPAINAPDLKVLLANQSDLTKPLNESKVPVGLKPYMVKLNTKVLTGQWLLSPKYSQFITGR